MVIGGQDGKSLCSCELVDVMKLLNVRCKRLWLLGVASWVMCYAVCCITLQEGCSGFIYDYNIGTFDCIVNEIVQMTSQVHVALTFISG